jgi:hypothetical protein
MWLLNASLHLDLMRSYQSVTTHITVEFDWDYIFTTVFRQTVCPMAVSYPVGTKNKATMA